MMTHHDNDAQTWRDLTGQLTTVQVESMERAEQWVSEASLSEGKQRDELLKLAREHAIYNLADTQLADVPVPDGAHTDTEGWTHDKAGNWSRALSWRDFESASRASVSVNGRQDFDGGFSVYVALYSDGRVDLTSVEARALAAQLIEAADLLDAVEAAR